MLEMFYEDLERTGDVMTFEQLARKKFDMLFLPCSLMSAC